MTPRTVRDATRELLRELGLTTVFGNPGTTEVPFLTDWPGDFRYVLGLQESVVVAMADGYAQAARKPVLVNLHSAGGVGHGLGSVFTAYRNNTPMVVIAGQQNRSLLPGDPFLGATDAAEFPKPYVKWSCEPARAQDVPAAIERAFHIATQAPQGPTFVSVPADDWDVEMSTLVPARRRVPGFAADPDALRELADALDASVRPGFVVGPGVDADFAVEDVVALAERLKAGVWASPLSSRCSFPENHALFRGFLQPERGATAKALGEHDVVVVIGAPAFTYHVVRPETLYRLPPLFVVSDDEQILARAEGTGIRATPKLAIRQLLDVVSASDRRPPPALVRPSRPTETSPLSAAYVYAELSDSLPDNAVVVEEAPSHRNMLHDHLPISSPDSGFLTMASGSLGYGLPAAVGAAISRPDRKIVAVIGDGSSMYGIQALWTAAREQLPVTFVILDNAQYAAVRVLGDALGAGRLPGVELGGIDFGAVAGGLGCVTYRVETASELKAALAASLVEDRPTLLHVVIDGDVPPSY
jgi:benzoylformate decarboxylase